MLTEFEHNRLKEDSIRILSELYPDVNVRNLIKEKWCFPLGIPFFYIEIDYDIKRSITKNSEVK